MAMKRLFVWLTNEYRERINFNEFYITSFFSIREYDILNKISYKCCSVHIPDFRLEVTRCSQSKYNPYETNNYIYISIVFFKDVESDIVYYEDFAFLLKQTVTLIQF